MSKLATIEDGGIAADKRPGGGGFMALVVMAVICFAANSVLARLALGDRLLDASTYTGLRIVSGAMTLQMLLAARRSNGGALFTRPAGSWTAAGSLFGYMIAFSVAYLRLGAGLGALLLFGTVQLVMVSWAIHKGDRPGAFEWVGLVTSFCGLVYLVSPGLVAPDPLGSLLMMAAGLCWAVYTLLGRGSVAPLSDTAGNFVRCAPIGLCLAAAGLAVAPVSLLGIVYAILSGAVASGLGYAIWYAVLPGLSRTRAALIQLTVPLLATGGGILFIGESLTLRLVVASAAILGGVTLSIWSAAWRYR